MLRGSPGCASRNALCCQGARAGTLESSRKAERKYSSNRGSGPWIEWRGEEEVGLPCWSSLMALLVDGGGQNVLNSGGDFQYLAKLVENGTQVNRVSMVRLEIGLACREAERRRERG